jgi:DNA-binding PadR family transcriptional regulator
VHEYDEHVAKRRPVSNLLALAVLATLVQRPMHPYEMASVLKARGKDEDMRFKWGSLYTVVGNLAKHGLIETVETQRQGARPERTVYRITDTGREELTDWVRELLRAPEPETSRFEAGLSVLGALGPGEVTQLLGERLSLLDNQIQQRRTRLADELQWLPRLFLLESEYELRAREAEADWVRGLLGELTEGTFPGLAQWRAYHETGEVPAELADLAKKGETP